LSVVPDAQDQFNDGELYQNNSEDDLDHLDELDRRFALLLKNDKIK